MMAKDNADLSFNFSEKDATALITTKSGNHPINPDLVALYDMRTAEGTPVRVSPLLRMLNEEKAEWNPETGALMISYESLASLEQHELQSLALPGYAPIRMKIRSWNNLVSPDFRVKTEFTNHLGLAGRCRNRTRLHGNRQRYSIHPARTAVFDSQKIAGVQSAPPLAKTSAMAGAIPRSRMWLLQPRRPMPMTSLNSFRKGMTPLSASAALH